eukprot:gene9326-11051_t
MAGDTIPKTEGVFPEPVRRRTHGQVESTTRAFNFPPSAMGSSTAFAGPHRVIPHPELRAVWGRHFPDTCAVSWDDFYAKLLDELAPPEVAQPDPESPRDAVSFGEAAMLCKFQRYLRGSESSVRALFDPTNSGFVTVFACCAALPAVDWQTGAAGAPLGLLQAVWASLSMKRSALGECFSGGEHYTAQLATLTRLLSYTPPEDGVAMGETHGGADNIRDPGGGAEGECHISLAQPGAAVVVCGPRQSGKTALVERALHEAVLRVTGGIEIAPREVLVRHVHAAMGASTMDDVGVAAALAYGGFTGRDGALVRALDALQASPARCLWLVIDHLVDSPAARLGALAASVFQHAQARCPRLRLVLVVTSASLSVVDGVQLLRVERPPSSSPNSPEPPPVTAPSAEFSTEPPLENEDSAGEGAEEDTDGAGALSQLGETAVAVLTLAGLFVGPFEARHVAAVMQAPQAAVEAAIGELCEVGLVQRAMASECAALPMYEYMEEAQIAGRSCTGADAERCELQPESPFPAEETGRSGWGEVSLEEAVQSSGGEQSGLLEMWEEALTGGGAQRARAGARGESAAPDGYPYSQARKGASLSAQSPVTREHGQQFVAVYTDMIRQWESDYQSRSFQ